MLMYEKSLVFPFYQDSSQFPLFSSLCQAFSSIATYGVFPYFPCIFVQDTVKLTGCGAHLCWTM